MLNVTKLFKQDRLMRAVTGLTMIGFQNLAATFSQVLIRERQQDYVQGMLAGTRERQPGGGRKGSLASSELKLLFLLLYFKCYPTLDLVGLIFNLDRANVLRNIRKLTPLLERTLGKKLALPKRRISTLEEFFQAFPEAREVFTDGTERPVQRPKNKKRQKDCYSGKKKTHTRKNIILSDKRRRIGYLGPTMAGRCHDYALFKEEFPVEAMPRDLPLFADLGFLGLAKDYPNLEVRMPKRKPCGHDLTFKEKQQNKKISRIRISVEHALAGVKRLKIVSDKFRNKSDQFNDQAMNIACGLWNYQLEYC